MVDFSPNEINSNAEILISTRRLSSDQNGQRRTTPLPLLWPCDAHHRPKQTAPILASSVLSAKNLNVPTAVTTISDLHSFRRRPLAQARSCPPQSLRRSSSHPQSRKWLKTFYNQKKQRLIQLTVTGPRWRITVQSGRLRKFNLQRRNPYSSQPVAPQSGESTVPWVCGVEVFRVADRKAVRCLTCEKSLPSCSELHGQMARVLSHLN